MAPYPEHNDEEICAATEFIEDDGMSAIAVIDGGNFHIKWMNARYARTLDSETQTPPYHAATHLPFAHQSDRESALLAFQQAARHGESYEHPHASQIRWADPPVCWLWSAAPLPSASTRFDVVFRALEVDPDASMDALPPPTAATEADLRYCSVANACLAQADVWLSLQDGDLRYTWTHHPLPGFTESEMLGRSDAELFPRAEDHEPLVELKRRVHHTGTTLRREIRLHTKEGERFFDFTVAPAFNAAGQHIGVASTAVEITTHRHVAIALRRNRARLTHLMHAGTVAIAFCDAQGRFLEVNDAFLALTGYERERLFERTMQLDALTPDDHVAFDLAAREEVAATGLCSPYERDVLCEDGTRVPVLASLARLPGAEFEWVVYFVDNAERKRAERELEALNRSLEVRVQERTQALVQYQARLRSLASELTLAEERERRRLAGDLHDYLAQLLVASRMTLERTRKLVRSPMARRLLRELDASLMDSLNYTRTLVAQLSPVILFEAGLSAAIEWLARQMKRYGLNVTFEQDPLAFALPEDQSIVVFQAVRELLFNIVKHAHTDAARVYIRQGDDHHALITVEDDGAGFDFPATVACAALEGKFGLFSIQERLEALGGSLEIVSRPGKGTTAQIAVFRNSVAPVREDAPGETLTETIEPGPNTARGRLIRVVLADDHEMVRKGLRSLLHCYSDLQVIGEASDGEEAYAQVKALRPDVVVMDINMPRVNGIEATRRIRREFPDTEVVALSVFDNDAIAEAMAAAGATAYLTKGGPPDKLHRALLATRPR